MFLPILLFVSVLKFSASTDYKAVEELDLTKYVGKWYQVYEDRFNHLFQGDGTCATAEYTLNNNTVSVLNQQLNRNGKYDSITGSAYYKDGDCCGYLTVILEGTPEAPYWVLGLGPLVDGYYDYSIVSDNKALSLFVLARDVERYYKLYDDNVLNILNDFGFNKKYNTPMIMDQSKC